MKIRVILILLLFSSMVSAQPGKKKKNAVCSKPPVPLFFASQNLCPDSALTPCLYYEVYDWLGTRYKYSGETKKGIDCSGFVSKIYESAYCIQLQGGSKDIWTTVIPIEKQDLREGDMVFFKIKKGQISHVGIYLGHNKFAHASVKNGVIISDLDEDYYKKYFYKGGRNVAADEAMMQKHKD